MALSSNLDRNLIIQGAKMHRVKTFLKYLLSDKEMSEITVSSSNEASM